MTGDELERGSQSRVRSFVRRGGRTTRAQRRALATLWPRFGLPAEGPLDLDRVFERSAPRFLEIGFGMGDALAEMATLHPQRDYLGIDVHEAGIGRLLLLLQARGIENVRVLRGDAVDLLSRRLPDASLDAVLIFFPDPWPKKRHHKRRLVQREFVDLVTRRLRPGARLQLATDWLPYAEQMLAVLGREPRLRNVHGPGRFAPDGAERPATKFQRRGERLGHPIRDLVFERVASNAATA